MRRTGIDILNRVPWGTHICHLYRTKEDVLDILIPYFKAGLEANEFCLWVTSEPLTVEEAKAALRQTVWEIDDHLIKHQIQIVDYSQFYTEFKNFEDDKAEQNWIEYQNKAVQRGFEGVRFSLNNYCLEESEWKKFVKSEEVIEELTEKYQMIAICSYCLDSYKPTQVIEVVSRHRLALMKQAGQWEVVSNAGRKRSESLIARQSQIIEQLCNAVISTDLEGYITGWNKGAEILFGYSLSESMNKHIGFLYPDQDCGSFVNKTISYVKERGKHEVEVRARRKSGDDVYVYFHLFLLEDNNGSATSIIGYGTDKTEYRHVVEDLSLLREEFSKAFHSSPDAIAISRLRDGCFVDVNDGLLRTTGYCREELIGHTSKELGFWPKPQDRAKLVRTLRKKGFVRDLEVKLRMKSSDIQVGLLSAQVINIGGEPHSIAVVHDITERKLVEEQLRKSREELRNLSIYLQQTKEEEGAHFAREIHDELGAALTALKMDLSWLDKRLPKEQTILLEKIGSMSRLIDITAETVKSISTRLRPKVLDDLGLIVAMEWLAQEFHERTHIATKLNLKAPDFMLDPELATSFFRIFQEALTNIARHANATSVTVSLKKRANKLVLKIKDNGKGIAQERINDPRSFGLLGMRERSRFWGGDVKITSNHGKGTIVIVNIPLHLKGKKR